MSKRLAFTFIAFLLVGALVFVAGWLGNRRSVGLPQQITAATPCPVAGCTQVDGGCHAADPPPQPDGNFEMQCPRVKDCGSVQCHAWGRIEAMRSKPSGASMNLWIIAPVVLVLTLVAVVRKL